MNDSEQTDPLIPDEVPIPKSNEFEVLALTDLRPDRNPRASGAKSVAASRPSRVWRVLRGLVVGLGVVVMSWLFLVVVSYLFLVLVAKTSGPLLKMQ